LKTARERTKVQGAAKPWRNAQMAWKKPRVTEVSLALEINSYACAELG
jgi:coenzyme PQQ precursor peptide PqqA